MNVSSMSEVIIAKYADYASMELLLEYHVPLAISQMTSIFYVKSNLQTSAKI